MAAMTVAGSRRCRGSLPSLLVSVLAALGLLAGNGAGSFAAPTRLTGPALRASTEALPTRGAWGSAGMPSTRAGKSTTARRIFGLGTSEILVILAVGAVFFGPETLKGFAKEAGKAAADLKDVPKAFEEGMETAASEKALDSGEAKVVEAKVEKESKAAEKESKEEAKK
uniref:Uncharacterized protein n=1 Tax=Alexandrium monilatum TaxID=311494 RepID=A0A7S4S6R9_9DINO|mmetsp:Transcript_67636/g.201143  ORF Transcript_67636/g.201143 Transcript_67636/m.201143 type:complete len:169 (-) Transcript_67636:68-574(-)